MATEGKRTWQAQKTLVPHKVSYLYNPSLKPLCCNPQRYSEYIHLCSSPLDQTGLDMVIQRKADASGIPGVLHKTCPGPEGLHWIWKHSQGNSRHRKSPEEGVESEGNRLREKERCEALKPSPTGGRTQSFFKRQMVRLQAQMVPEIQVISFFSSALKFCPCVSTFHKMALATPGCCPPSSATSVQAVSLC